MKLPSKPARIEINEEQDYDDDDAAVVSNLTTPSKDFLKKIFTPEVKETWKEKFTILFTQAYAYDPEGGDQNRLILQNDYNTC